MREALPFAFQYTISIGLNLDTNAADWDDTLHIWNAEQQFEKETEQKSIRAYLDNRDDKSRTKPRISRFPSSAKKLQDLKEQTADNVTDGARIRWVSTK